VHSLRNANRVVRRDSDGSNGDLTDLVAESESRLTNLP
jgi:hypothetical protein